MADEKKAPAKKERYTNLGGPVRTSTAVVREFGQSIELTLEEYGDAITGGCHLVLAKVFENTFSPEEIHAFRSPGSPTGVFLAKKSVLCNHSRAAGRAFRKERLEAAAKANAAMNKKKVEGSKQAAEEAARVAQAAIETANAAIG